MAMEQSGFVVYVFYFRQHEIQFYGFSFTLLLRNNTIYIGKFCNLSMTLLCSM